MHFLLKNVFIIGLWVIPGTASTMASASEVKSPAIDINESEEGSRSSSQLSSVNLPSHAEEPQTFLLPPVTRRQRPTASPRAHSSQSPAFARSVSAPVFGTTAETEQELLAWRRQRSNELLEEKQRAKEEEEDRKEKAREKNLVKALKHGKLEEFRTLVKAEDAYIIFGNATLLMLAVTHLQLDIVRHLLDHIKQDINTTVWHSYEEDSPAGAYINALDIALTQQARYQDDLRKGKICAIVELLKSRGAKTSQALVENPRHMRASRVLSPLSP